MLASWRNSGSTCPPAVPLAHWAQRSDGRSCRTRTILPEILPLGSLDDDSPDVVLDSLLDSSLPPAVSDLERRMILGELVLEWSSRLKHAVVSIDSNGAIKHAPETHLVGAHPVDAWRLAGELAKLIDEMIIEEVAWGDLHDLNGDFDEYWRLDSPLSGYCTRGLAKGPARTTRH